MIEVTTVCCYCGKILRVDMWTNVPKELIGAKSHGICEDCYENVAKPKLRALAKAYGR